MRVYIQKIQLSDDVVETLGPEEEALLENDPQVHRLLSLYLIIFKFLEPVHASLMETPFDQHEFRLTCFNSKNVMTTFLLQLVGGTFAFLNLSSDDSKSKSCSRQCAEKILKFFFDSFKNPFILLEIVEERMCYPVKDPVNGPSNIFLQDERVSLLSIAMVFYLMYVHDLLPLNLPTVYRPQYLSDQIMRLVLVFLKRSEANLNYKGVELGLNILDKFFCILQENDIDSLTMMSLFERLEVITVYSTVERNRKAGIKLFGEFINKHSPAAQHHLVSHLFHTIQNDGVKGFVTMRYKNLIASQLPDVHCDFETTVLQHICVLKDAEKTDLMDGKESILAALNMLIFLLIRDRQNDTTIWDLIRKLESTFLAPLRRGIDLSRAHYKNDYQRVLDGPEIVKQDTDFDILNGDQDDGETVLTKAKTLEIISYSLNTFDIMESSLVRVNECISIRNKM